MGTKKSMRTAAAELFEKAITGAEQRAVGRLGSPHAIQLFLDALSYGTVTVYRAPLRVLRERTCQCFDGAVFAAAMLHRIGYPALVMDLLPNDRDDDHVLALYRQGGHWGAVAKSNFVCLRSREPVYRSLRELVMSYFEHYYNISREKTLRGYTLPLDLKAFDRHAWMTSDETMDLISDRLDSIRRVRLLNRSMIARLAPVDTRFAEAGLFGANRAGLYRPPKKRT